MRKRLWKELISLNSNLVSEINIGSLRLQYDNWYTFDYPIATDKKYKYLSIDTLYRPDPSEFLIFGYTNNTQTIIVRFQNGSGTTSFSDLIYDISQYEKIILRFTCSHVTVAITGLSVHN